MKAVAVNTKSNQMKNIHKTSTAQNTEKQFFKQTL